MEHQKTNSNSQRQNDDWDEVHNQLLNVQQAQQIQKKSLTVSAPGDPDEKEADEVARKVLSGESAEVHGIGGAINRKGEGSAETTAQFQSKLESSKGSGQPLNDSTRSEMESKMGADFSSVKIHTGGEANNMSESINAKAFTHGQDIYFSQQDSAANKELLAHELVHTVQQRNGAGERIIQRTAKATWQDVTFDDRFNAMSKPKQWLYKQQQKRKANNKKLLLNEVQLPEIEKILNIAANYHYYTGFPDFGGAPDVTLDQSIIDEIRRQFKMNTTPDFWKNMIWKSQDGTPHNIGVRFNINFVPHIPAGETLTERYMGSGLYNTPAVSQNPWDNVLRLGTIDQMQEDMRLNWNEINNYIVNNNINTIAINIPNQTAAYTPHDGGPVVNYNLQNQGFELINQIRSEITRLGLDMTIANSVLGWSTNKTVSIDQQKIQTVKTPLYTRVAGEVYGADMNEEFNKSKTFNASKKERPKRIASVIAHEIGHNIGMGHSDLGVMNEHAESVSIQQERTTLNGRAVDMAKYANFPHHDLQPHNVQILVNRIRSMTIEDLQQRRPDDNVLPDKSNYWGNMEQQMRNLLMANNIAAILASDLYTSMLSIPYEKGQISELETAGTITSDDAKILRRVAKTPGFRIVLADWNLLSVGAQNHIMAESLRLVGGQGPGLTYFETAAEMNQPF